MYKCSSVKPGSQYDAHASIVSWASGWRWNRLDFYSIVVLRALASVQPIRLLRNLTSGMQFDLWKNTFSLDVLNAHDARSTSVILWTRLYMYVYVCNTCVQSLFSVPISAQDSAHKHWPHLLSSITCHYIRWACIIHTHQYTCHNFMCIVYNFSFRS